VTTAPMFRAHPSLRIPCRLPLPVLCHSFVARPW
jgi:hypothetical protein